MLYIYHTFVVFVCFTLCVFLQVLYLHVLCVHVHMYVRYPLLAITLLSLLRDMLN